MSLYLRLRRWVRCLQGTHTALRYDEDAWSHCWYCSANLGSRNGDKAEQELHQWHRERYRLYGWPKGGVHCGCHWELQKEHRGIGCSAPNTITVLDAIGANDPRRGRGRESIREDPF